MRVMRRQIVSLTATLVRGSGVACLLYGDPLPLLKTTVGELKVKLLLFVSHTKEKTQNVYDYKVAMIDMLLI